MVKLQRVGKGTVLKGGRGFYHVLDENHNVMPCYVKGNIFGNNSYNCQIAVGDRVSFLWDEGVDRCLIWDVDRRDACLARRRKINGVTQVLIANANQAWVVASILFPEMRLPFILRCCYAAKIGGIEPILVITKKDLVAKRKIKEISGLFEQIGIKVLSYTIENPSRKRLFKRLAIGKSTVVVGQSGVGKSTLLNSIWEHLNLKSKSVSDKTRKGRHTTSTAEMFQVEKNTFIVDTPGLREFEIIESDVLKVSKQFMGIERLAPLCKYKNCLHKKEPGCAIVSAVKENRYPPLIYSVYLEMIKNMQGNGNDVEKC